jgi:hypothetical protein
VLKMHGAQPAAVLASRRTARRNEVSNVFDNSSLSPPQGRHGLFLVGGRWWWRTRFGRRLPPSRSAAHTDIPHVRPARLCSACSSSLAPDRQTSSILCCNAFFQALTWTSSISSACAISLIDFRLLMASKLTRALNCALNIRLFRFIDLWVLSPGEPVPTLFIPWLRLREPIQPVGIFFGRLCFQ